MVITSYTRFCYTLTGGIRTHGKKNLKNLRGHIITEEPNNFSEVTCIMCDMEC
jgi:hypothetical protein